jgi:uncharacterized Fe-S cluster protein YjdI
MQKNSHYYKKDKTTVIWKPALCTHSGICFRGLPSVFDPRRKPWIVTENADEAEIVAQVLCCPSGALSIKTEEN